MVMSPLGSEKEENIEIGATQVDKSQINKNNSDDVININPELVVVNKENDNYIIAKVTDDEVKLISVKEKIDLKSILKHERTYDSKQVKVDFTDQVEYIPYDPNDDDIVEIQFVKELTQRVKSWGAIMKRMAEDKEERKQLGIDDNDDDDEDIGILDRWAKLQDKDMLKKKEIDALKKKLEDEANFNNPTKLKNYNKISKDTKKKNKIKNNKDSKDKIIVNNNEDMNVSDIQITTKNNDKNYSNSFVSHKKTELLETNLNPSDLNLDLIKTERNFTDLHLNLTKSKTNLLESKLNSEKNLTELGKISSKTNILYDTDLEINSSEIKFQFTEEKLQISTCQNNRDEINKNIYLTQSEVKRNQTDISNCNNLFPEKNIKSQNLDFNENLINAGISFCIRRNSNGFITENITLDCNKNNIKCTES